MELTRADIENNLAFLERSQLTGKEAEVMVSLRYKLVEMRNDLIKKAKAASPIIPSKSNDKPTKPKGKNRPKPK